MNALKTKKTAIGLFVAALSITGLTGCGSQDIEIKNLRSKGLSKSVGFVVKDDIFNIESDIDTITSRVGGWDCASSNGEGSECVLEIIKPTFEVTSPVRNDIVEHYKKAETFMATVDDKVAAMKADIIDPEVLKLNEEKAVVDRLQSIFDEINAMATDQLKAKKAAEVAVSEGYALAKKMEADMVTAINKHIVDNDIPSRKLQEGAQPANYFYYSRSRQSCPESGYIATSTPNLLGITCSGLSINRSVSGIKGITEVLKPFVDEYVENMIRLELSSRDRKGLVAQERDAEKALNDAYIIAGNKLDVNPTRTKSDLESATRRYEKQQARVEKKTQYANETINASYALNDEVYQFNNELNGLVRELKNEVIESINVDDYIINEFAFEGVPVEPISTNSSNVSTVVIASQYTDRRGSFEMMSLDILKAQEDTDGNISVDLDHAVKSTRFPLRDNDDPKQMVLRLAAR
jgi:hypothetical protein